MSDWSAIEFFKPEEFACPCDMCVSNGTEMNIEFVKVLDTLRGIVGVPFIVSSGYRCPDYNIEVSSTGRDGPHTTGRAVDILMNGPTVVRTMALVLSTWRHSISGIGLHQRGPHAGRFIHLDNLGAPYPRPRIWTY